MEKKSRRDFPIKGDGCKIFFRLVTIVCEDNERQEHLFHIVHQVSRCCSFLYEK